MEREILRRIFVFNGDADGLCALQQMRLSEAVPAAELVSGPKRHTRIVGKVRAGVGDEVTVLDLSFDSNRAAVAALLDAGARVRYFDHHHAGELPAHERFEAHIDTSPATCTSAIVDGWLGGRQRRWAAVGAFGDNLIETGRRLGAQAGLAGEALARLEELGMLLNYNAYGESEDDLHFAPCDLHRRLLAHADPLSFAAGDEAYATLKAGYADDMRRVAALEPAQRHESAAVYVLPDASWARRVSGVVANQLARGAPGRAHAVLSPNLSGGMQVSVRAPLEHPTGAAALCLGFPGGGGREAAAGINHLARDEVASFTRRFLAHFAR